jgi:hypothetical protein
MFSPLSELVQTEAVLALSTLLHVPSLARVRVRIRVGLSDCETQATVSELSVGETATDGWLALPAVSTWKNAPEGVNVFVALS